MERYKQQRNFLKSNFDEFKKIKTDIVENENFPNITNVLAEIKGRIISENLLRHDQQLDYASVDTVLYVGDDKNKMYRYTDKLKADFSKSFIE